ncbi:TPA: transporter [Clostridioides difficile]|nr:transporter [Clostridioides difficile]
MENERRNEVFSNEELGVNVRTISYEDGSIGINAEDTAIGFGWYQTQNKSGKKYISIRWERVNEFCSEFGFPHKWGKDDYIPEALFYMLGMKAKNEAAVKFQKWLAIDVIPTIRKHGAYMTDTKIEEILSNPDTIIKLATELKEKREKIKQLETEVVHKEDVIIGLVEDISLAEKRQRINQIVKYKAEPKNFSKRWNLLYDEFEKKYHLNLKRRINNCDIKPKIKNKIDYIDREMNMIPQLYEITCKLFENDVEELKNEWISVIEEKVC